MPGKDRNGNDFEVKANSRGSFPYFNFQYFFRGSQEHTRKCNAPSLKKTFLNTKFLFQEQKKLMLTFLF